MSKFLAFKKLFLENTEKPGISVSTEKNVKKFAIFFVMIYQNIGCKLIPKEEKKMKI